MPPTTANNNTNFLDKIVDLISNLEDRINKKHKPYSELYGKNANTLLRKIDEITEYINASEENGIPVEESLKQRLQQCKLYFNFYDLIRQIINSEDETHHIADKISIYFRHCPPYKLFLEYLLIKQTNQDNYEPMDEDDAYGHDYSQLQPIIEQLNHAESTEQNYLNNVCSAAIREEEVESYSWKDHKVLAIYNKLIEQGLNYQLKKAEWYAELDRWDESRDILLKEFDIAVKSGKIIKYDNVQDCLKPLLNCVLNLQDWKTADYVTNAILGFEAQIDPGQLDAIVRQQLTQRFFKGGTSEWNLLCTLYENGNVPEDLAYGSLRLLVGLAYCKLDKFAAAEKIYSDTQNYLLQQQNLHDISPTKILLSRFYLLELMLGKISPKDNLWQSSVSKHFNINVEMNNSDIVIERTRLISVLCDSPSHLETNKFLLQKYYKELSAALDHWPCWQHEISPFIMALKKELAQKMTKLDIAFTHLSLFSLDAPAKPADPDLSVLCLR